MVNDGQHPLDDHEKAKKDLWIQKVPASSGTYLDGNHLLEITGIPQDRLAPRIERRLGSAAR